MLFPNLEGLPQGKHFIKLLLRTLKLWLLTNVQRKILSGDGSDNVAGYNNRTSGKKPLFRLFCVAVDILETEACGS